MTDDDGDPWGDWKGKRCDPRALRRKVRRLLYECADDERGRNDTNGAETEG